MRTLRNSGLAVVVMLSLASLTGCDELFDLDFDSDGGSGGGGGGSGATVDVKFRVAVFAGTTPVNGASVYLDGAATPTATTVSGIADFSAKVGTEVGVRISKKGFVDNVQTVRRDNGITRLMINAWIGQVGTTQKVDPALGATISSGGAQVVIPANALQAPGGTANVDVELTYLEGNEVEQVGTFRIQNPSTKAPSDEVLLQSLGVVVLAARDPSGNEVRINGAVGAQIIIPANIPAGQTVAVMPPLWKQDPNTGDWVRQTTDWQLDTAAKVWRAQINALATWNCDYPSQVTCVTGTLLGTNSKPLGGVDVKGVMTGKAASFLDSTTVQVATTGSDGDFCMEVIPASNLTLTVTVPGGSNTTLFSGMVTAPKGLRCGATASCQALAAGSAGCFTDEDCDATKQEKCRLGKCVPPAACSDQTNAGGDIPDERTFEMVKASGTFDFSYDTYSIKDQVIVTQGGKTLFDSGCVGENKTTPLTLNGTGTQIVIRIVPNCACTDPAGCTGTAWDYVVGCPK